MSLVIPMTLPRHVPLSLLVLIFHHTTKHLGAPHLCIKQLTGAALLWHRCLWSKERLLIGLPTLVVALGRVSLESLLAAADTFSSQR